MSNFQQHDDDTCPHLVRASLLEAENAHLKAEGERLRKAGDAMAVEVNGRYFGKRLIKDWNAAKEGKQS